MIFEKKKMARIDSILACCIVSAFRLKRSMMIQSLKLFGYDPNCYVWFQTSGCSNECWSSFQQENKRIGLYLLLSELIIQLIQWKIQRPNFVPIETVVGANPAIGHPAAVPHLTSSSQTIRVTVADSIRLPCDVQNLGQYHFRRSISFFLSINCPSFLFFSTLSSFFKNISMCLSNVKANLGLVNQSLW